MKFHEMGVKTTRGDPGRAEFHGILLNSTFEVQNEMNMKSGRNYQGVVVPIIISFHFGLPPPT